ncbi:MAG: polyphenol oxidase family protein [Bdellovibrionales bacterium]
MIGQRVLFKNQVYGSELIRDNFHYFFGTAACTREILRDIYPQYEFRFLKQVHGDALVESQPETQTADAHWTKQTRLGLVIQTADCLPVLFGTDKLIVAAHAGWRGVENNLLIRCARFVQENKCQLDCVLVGPHIQAPDFEVGLDVANQLIQRYKEVVPNGPLPVLPHPEASKRRVNLGQIAAAQLRSVLGAMIPLEVSRESTFSSPMFHSFRRGKSPDARQYSFVARL